MNSYAKIRNPLTVIILSIITCGIYGLYWIYNTNRQINDLKGSVLSSGGFVIFSMFCCQILIWLIEYRWDDCLDEIAPPLGVRYKSNFVMWLLLTLLFGVGQLVAMYQVQSALNNIYQQKGIV
ncbi:MAG: DUF4234 domain-containing protein [Oscillospiraceae bacterium]|jgi:hypothetical protein|nr:DUF4234 domain-containing protein [Oscillospiraceae bacterium]